MILPGQIATGQATAITGSVHLRVLATTDLHAHLLPFDYFTDTRAPGIGLARLGRLIAQARAEVPNILLLDNGDTLQGTPLADTALSEIVPAGRANPMIAAMNAIGYDAATLGNHDFDFGLDYLERSLRDASFPVVCANVTDLDGAPFLPPSCLLTRDVTALTGLHHTLRIGVIGALPPQTAHWNRPHVHDRLLFGDILGAVSAQVSALRAKGADLVVVLGHTGYGAIDAPAMAENVALQIADLQGVDAVVAGHTHKIRPDGPLLPCGGTPIVQPGAFGSHLGCIDLILSPPDARSSTPADPPGAEPPPAWRVQSASAGTYSASGPPPPQSPFRRILNDFPNLRQAIAREHRATRAFVSRPLGATITPLCTFFSTIAPCAATQLVADAQSAAALPLIAQVPSLSGLPVLSAVAPFKAGGRSGPSSFTDVPPGPLKLRHAADLYLYPNLLSVLRLSGTGLISWLERSASIYKRIEAGASAPQFLIDHDYAPYNFDRILGLTYQIDVSRQARTNAEGDVLYDTPGRIRDLRFADGTPVAPEDEVLVVTNSYRAAGGGHMDAAGAAEVVLTADFSVRDAVARNIAGAKQPICPVVAPNFSLRPLGGISVIFETGPGALQHLCHARALGLTPMTDSAALAASDGFQPFLMSL